MAHTEAEAKKKWCPLVRMPSDLNASGSTAENAVACNRKHTGELPTCVGSNCMLWRWRDKAVIEIKSAYEKPHGDGWKYTGGVPAHVIGGTWEREIGASNRQGYCGYGSRPEWNR